MLHGGSGIQQEYILEAMKHGIAKINIATEIRQPYEMTLKETGSVEKAQESRVRAHRLGPARSPAGSAGQRQDDWWFDHLSAFESGESR